MTPEAELATLARNMALPGWVVERMLELMREARGLGSLAGAAAQKEADAVIADDAINCHDGCAASPIIAAAIRTQVAP